MDQFELIEQGAEARVLKGSYLGKVVIAKERFSKKYRNPELDITLTKERMKAECRAIMKCKSAGIPSPCLYLVDFCRRTIIMEFYENNVRVKDFIEGASKIQLEWLAEEIGKAVGKLHANNITHGDLTTSNMLLVNKNTNAIIDHNNSHLVIIDFGLSQMNTSNEDKGVDLYVLERAVLSTHACSEEIFPIIIKAYKMTNETGFKKVISKYEEVRTRGRKRTMVG